MKELAARVISGERRALAQAITLVESLRADHRAQASQLIDRLRATGRQASRIGLSGTPGVGKSTFIETFGSMLTGQGLRVAVLAVDPSSTLTGGSILGDKTRMERLTRDPRAFIRPSPSQTSLGGVARRTREAVMLCEAAGFDVVVIETVGVGQSETMVADMADLFLLLMAPAGGDELQGVKRGIMEIADMILVNKSDGDLVAAANRTCADYTGALRLLRPRKQDPPGFPKVMSVSALDAQGIDVAWDEMRFLIDWRKTSKNWENTRSEQARGWFLQEVEHLLLGALETPVAQTLLAETGDKVANGTLTPGTAAAELVARLQKP